MTTATLAAVALIALIRAGMASSRTESLFIREALILTCVAFSMDMVSRGRLTSTAHAVLMMCTVLCCTLPARAWAEPGSDAESSVGIAAPVPSADAWDPPVCTSFEMATTQSGKSDNVVESCPTGSAFVGESALNSTAAKAFQATVLIGSCCPLPPDALTTVRHLFFGSCPPDSVVTGLRSFNARAKEIDEPAMPTNLFECTFINTARYQLGAPGLAVRITTLPYGVDRTLGKALLGLEQHLTSSWGRIPPGIRYAIARIDHSGRDVHSCAGYPWGSLLSGRADTSRCGFAHRQLQYVGRNGDPVRGSPVAIYPECDAIEDPHGPQPRCIRHAPVGGVPVHAP